MDDPNILLMAQNNQNISSRNDTPLICKGTISFIQPILLRNLLTQNISFKDDKFNFLILKQNEYAEYAEYYRKFEVDRENEEQPTIIPNLGDLLPLRRKHSLHSYWRAFRRKSYNNTSNELCSLLPLKIDIPIEPLRVCDCTYDAYAYIYLFPFGCCVFNLDVKIDKISLTKIGEFVNKLNGSTIKLRIQSAKKTKNNETVAFKQFIKETATIINKELFGEGDMELEGSPKHNFIFIEKCENALRHNSPNHRKAIYASLKQKTITDISTIRDSVVDSFLKDSQMEAIRNNEYLFLTPNSSFYHVSPQWSLKSQDTQEGNSRKNNRKKIKCMRKNYQSSLNVLFAVNSVLKEISKSQEMIEQYENCKNVIKIFNKAFLRHEDKIYFKHVFQKLAPKINLIDKLNTIGNYDNK